MNGPAAKISPLTLLLCAVIGAGGALLTQSYRSSIGVAPLSPPLSLPASLAVIAATLLILALRLKKYLGEERAGAVNPFHAVRLLAAARAAQFTGSIFAGFGGGLIAPILSRISSLSFTVWGPMALTIVTAGALLAAGLYAEHTCKIPPADTDEGEEFGRGDATEPDPV